MKAFHHIVYSLNALYIALLPTMAVVVQGKNDYEFLEQFPLLPDFTSNVLQALVWIFGIILIPVMLQTVKIAKTFWASLGLLFGGPSLGLLIAWLTNTPFEHAFFHLFLVEGAAFLLIITFLYFSQRKKGLEKAGPLMVYVITPAFILLFIIGFLSAINFDFFVTHYQTTWDYVALVAMILIGIAGLYTYMNNTNHQAFKINQPDQQEDASSFSMTGIILLAGIVAFTIREAFL